MLPAGFFFSFQQEFHVYRKPAGGLQQPLHGFDLNVNLPLVVARAAREDVVAAHLRFKRRRLPLVQRVRRLHIVMPIKQDRGLTRGAKPLRIDQRIAGSFDQAGGVHPRTAQFLNSEFRRAPDVGLVFGKRADARYAKEGLKAFQEFGLVLLIIVHA